MARKRRIDRASERREREPFTKHSGLPPLLVQLLLFGQPEAVVELNDPREAFVRVFNEDNAEAGGEARPL